jgi:hypothetical protein
MEITIRHVIEVSPELAALLERLVLALDGRRIGAGRSETVQEPGPASAVTAGPPPEELPRQNAPPAASGAVQGHRRSRWSSPERDAVLRAHWPAGSGYAVIWPLLEAASPGQPMPVLKDHIAARAAYLGLRRPPSALVVHLAAARAARAPRGVADAPAAPPPPPVAVAPAVPQTERPKPPPLPAFSLEDGKVYATFAEIRAWAGFYGFAYDGSNMDRLNKLRAAKGLPPLVQDDTRKAT